MPSVSPHVHPGLVLLVAEPVARQPADEFLRALRARLGDNPTVGVLDFRELRAGGFPPAPASFLGQVKFERWLADRATDVLRASGAVRSAHGKFLVTVVGLLCEESSRRYSVSVLPYIQNAFRRIALPAGIEPSIVGVSVLPERWTSLEAAGLFAWLKEFNGALRLAGRPGMPRYTMATVIARARATDRDEEEAVTEPETELARAAAEFTAACHTSGVVDWARANERGRANGTHFHTYGITSLSESDLRVQVELSQVLWPVLRDVRPRSGRAVTRALVGASDFAEPYLEGWERIPAARVAGGRAWLLRMAAGLQPEDLIGAEEWRFRYDRLPVATRASLHGIHEALDWPDPLTRPAPASTPQPEPLAV
ncbi:hypothetical protein [Longimicrobium sp.]|uniref:hypothetical protein n=1 Tax=Longimicrobium sp. TaxID=2029185 RepID=UPI002E32BB3E|nr:hypothetical protein [Longimicrobium sp.]HEX6040231.1 hypothetical protein [Longimicrobium sp.]